MLILQIAFGILLAVFVLHKFNILWPKREEIAWNAAQALMNLFITCGLLGFGVFCYFLVPR